MNKFYYVNIGSCYVQIVKIKFIHDNYIKAKVHWYSKVSMDLVCTQNNLKIPKHCFSFWKVKKFNQIVD